MLKTKNENFDNILKRLNVKKSRGKEILLKMSSFCDISRQNISVRTHESNHISEYHTHDFFEINYVHEGNCINLVEDENIIMDQGDMIIIHPGVFHTLYADGNCKVYNFLIHKDWLCEKAESLPKSHSDLCSFLKKAEADDYYKYMICPFSSNEENSANHIAKKLIDIAESDSPWKYLLQESTMLEYFSAIDQEQNNSRLSDGIGASSYKIINFLMYMTENYSTVTLDELSEKFFYSKTHICRLFLQNTGKSFNQTLIDMRLSRACSLLRNTDKTVEEISHEVGYGSTEYFQRLFKRKIGVTPGEFRKKY